MKKKIVREIVTFLLVSLVNVPIYMLCVPAIGWVTAFILLLIFDILLYWYADKRYYGFIHTILMTAGILGLTWVGIWDYHVIFDRMFHSDLKEILEMFLVAIISGGLWVLGIHYLIMQKEGES